MKVIAQTGTGFLIEATEAEIKNILFAVNGKQDGKIEVGQKIPAIDYASTITKIKSLKDSYDFKNLIKYAEEFEKSVEGLKKVVDSASNIEA